MSLLVIFKFFYKCFLSANREHHVGSVKVPIHTIHKHHYKKVPEYKIVKVEKIVEVKGTEIVWNLLTQQTDDMFFV